ncbi:MAG: PQQ-dependent sugar dehydrogenase [Phycisphaerales bacterium]|nr:PQQ-dependent sugar dehydrogenase [Phycisphaerales bacterium]
MLDQRIVYFEVDAELDVALGGEVFVAAFPVGTGVTRLGGQLGFGPDRTLYLLLGDGGGVELAQDPDFFPGKVLRFNDDGTIPTDNPGANSPLFARGLRAPRGLAFDPVSGEGFFADDSGNSHEVNRLVPGANYGWPSVVGVANTAAEREFVRVTQSYRDPILATDTPIVGAAFNPGNKYGLEVAGRLLYGVDELHQVRALTLSDSRLLAAGSAPFLGNLPGEIRAVAFTPPGTLYLAVGSSIVRIVEYHL